MPTVLRANGFEVRIFTNDHKPAHVHGYKAGGDAKVDIAGTTPILVTTTMSKRETIDLLVIIAANLAHLQADWNRIHGPLR